MVWFGGCAAAAGQLRWPGRGGVTAWRQLLSTVTPPVVREKLGALGLTKTPVADPAGALVLA